MVKKRLSDLLREEVQKPPSEPNASLQADESAQSDEPLQPDESAQSTAAKSTSRRTPRSTTTKTITLSEADVSPLPSEPSTHAVTAELEATVATMTENLKVANETAIALQKRVDELQAELSDQKTLVERLYTELQQSQQIQAELTEQKTLVKQLQADLEKAGQALQARSTPTPPPAPAKPPEARKPEGLALRPATTYRSLRPIGPAPAQPSSSSSSVSNEEIGWFD